MADFSNAYPKPITASNFISAAVRVNSELEIEHAGIIVKYLDNYKVFHFINKRVHFDDIEDEDWLFYKEINIINTSMAGPFYNLCTKVKGELAPKFGYHIDKSSMKNSGEYNSVTGMPFITTCVGFCLSMIRSVLLGKEFILIEDWNNTDNLQSKTEIIEKYIIRYKEEYPDFNEEEFRKNIRRILPIEYFVAAYFDDGPVRKKQVDEIVDRVAEDILKEVN